MNEIIVKNNTTAIRTNDTEGNLFDRWIMFIDGSEKTIETYKKDIKQFALWLAENGIENPQREDILAYREELKLTHKATTVQNYLMAVKQFFNWLEAEGLYSNVAKHVKGAKIDSEHKKGYLTIDQLKGLLSGIDRATLNGKRDYAMLAVMATTGLRTISIREADIKDLKAVGNQTALFYQGKGHEEKAIYVKIAQPVEEAINDYLRARKATDTSEPLFASLSNRNNGERMTTRSISRIAKEHLKDYGLDREDITAHSFRHTAGTQALLNGSSLEEVQQMLDHKSINTTMIYAHALDRINNASELRVAGAIFG